MTNSGVLGKCIWSSERLRLEVPNGRSHEAPDGRGNVEAPVARRREAPLCARPCKRDWWPHRPASAHPETIGRKGAL